MVESHFEEFYLGLGLFLGFQRLVDHWRWGFVLLAAFGLFWRLAAGLNVMDVELLVGIALVCEDVVLVFQFDYGVVEIQQIIILYGLLLVLKLELFADSKLVGVD